MTFISRVSGLARDLVTTSLQGANIYHDIYVVVLRIPASFRTFLVEGAFSNAFIPTYSNLLGQEKKNEAIAFLNSITFLVLFISIIFILLALLFPKIFILFFATGFFFDEEKLKIASNFNQIMFPYLGFVAAVSFAGGIQNSHYKFGVPAATPILFNITLISSGLLLGDYFKIPIFSIVWGVLIAGIFQLIIQIKPLLNLEIKLRPIFKPKLESFKKFKLLFLPSLIIGALMQINLLIDSIFSTFLEAGSPTWLYISQRLVQLPLGIFALAISTVLLPHLSNLFSSDQKDKFIKSIKQSILIILFIGFPSMTGIILLSEEIVGTIFLRGEFDNNDVYNSAKSLSILGLALPFLMLQRVFQPAFFSRFDSKAPLIISLVSILINISTNYILAIKLNFGHIGISGGFLFASLASCLGYYAMLVRKNFSDRTHFFNKVSLIALLSSILMGLYIYFISSYLDINNAPFIQKLTGLSFTITTSILGYFLLSYLFGIRLNHFKSQNV